MCDYEYTLPPREGWQCPKCGRILNPFQMFCPFCGGDDSKITIVSTGTGIPNDNGWWETYRQTTKANTCTGKSFEVCL